MKYEKFKRQGTSFSLSLSLSVSLSLSLSVSFSLSLSLFLSLSLYGLFDILYFKLRPHFSEIMAFMIYLIPFNVTITVTNTNKEVRRR